MSTQPTNFDQFLDLIEAWRTTYSFQVVQCVCIKVEGKKIVFASRVILVNRKDEFKSFKLETERIYAFTLYRRVRASNIDEIVSLLRDGGVTGPDGPIYMERGAHEHGSHLHPVYHPAVSEGPRLPSLSVRGPAKHSIFSAIEAYSHPLDWELKSAPAPFDSLDDLLAECGLPNQQALGDSSLIELVARAPGNFSNESQIRSGKALFQCRISDLAKPARVSFGYKIFRPTQTERGLVKPKAIQWSADEISQIGTHELELGDAAVVQGFLRYSGLAIHTWWLTDREKFLNSRLAIHKVFDPSLEILRRTLLNPDGDRAASFEWGISTLFNLLGFSTSNHGRFPKLQDGPDVLAISPSGNVAVIECTVGILDRNDKLAKLVQREASIQRSLSRSQASNAKVLPVIVTQLTAAEVKADIDAARTRRIAVITRENIENLLERVELPPAAEVIYSNLLSTLPNNDNFGLFGPR